MTDAALPDQLAEIRDDFLELDEKSRLQLLLEFSQELPDLPAKYADHPDLLERVVECQSPVYIFVDVESDAVHLHATAPRESPTTRGFASILAQAVDGLTPADVLAIPDDFPQMLGLTRVVSPLRLNGMNGMLRRTKRQLAERIAD
ncbi:SufE family protein [Mycetocola zhadangensis]|uniref:SufE family protein n=1 Tax=Mycetocola zhadangensis TaxID=1164595 RepID=A0A3L7J628_9MICO|nr:SufE family protein [Mycetocola zhadangensis]RLQ86076.1 SufE family protein [Mycetocola zhadangensis]GGE88183.1 cysteine desufuration protein SufE [Mycetocola zhadangensis]